MKSKIAHLKKVEPVVLEPNEALVERLREILADAESGKLRSMVFIGTTSDGDLVDGWTTAPEAHNPYMILAGIDVIHSEFRDFIKYLRSTEE
jgi:hypothetical protein